MPQISMADDAPPALPPRETSPPELPPREAVESLSLEEDVADLDAAAAADEGYEEEAADAAEALQEAPLTEEEEEARGVAQHLLLNAPPGEFSELLHAGLEAMYGDMADATFKALRRVMPITKLKMKWSVDALRLKGGLTKAAAEAY